MPHPPQVGWFTNPSHVEPLSLTAFLPPVRPAPPLNAKGSWLQGDARDPQPPLGWVGNAPPNSKPPNLKTPNPNLKHAEPKTLNPEP